MANDQNNKVENYILKIKDVRDSVYDPLSSNVYKTKENINSILNKVNSLLENKNKQQEAVVETQVSSHSEQVTPVVEKTQPIEVKSVPVEKPEPKVVEDVVVPVKTENVVSKPEDSQATVNTSNTEKPEQKIENTVYINNAYNKDGVRQYNNNRQDRPQGGYQGNGYQGNRPQGTGYQGNRPQGTGYQGNGYQGNRPQGTGYQGNGYQGNRPQGTGYQGNRPQGTGYQGNRPQGGYQGNRPQGSSFAKSFDFNNSSVVEQQKQDRSKAKILKPKTDDKHGLSKRELVKKGYEVDSSLYGDDFVVRTRTKKEKKAYQAENYKPVEEAVFTSINIPVRVFCEKIGKPVNEVIKRMFDLGKMVTINSVITFDEAELIAADLNIKISLNAEKTAEDKLSDILKYTEESSSANLVKRPPIVTIMGHVDHGKTTLLDYIRKANVVATEAGGITQHIGAYTIDVKGEKITFLDTPGHEAFTAMRRRGANVTDIAIIVVAADDKVMPQTIEAINHAKEANVAIIVAVNKIDKTDGDTSQIKEQLTHFGLVAEDWGGDTMVCPISAKFGQGVDALLDAILLQAEMLELKADKKCLARGSVIEARLDKSLGPVATILVQNGTLKVKDSIVAGNVIGKVKSMTDYSGKRVKEAAPSYAVQIQGFSEVPNAGEIMIAVKDEKLAKQVVQERLDKERYEMNSENTARTLEDMFKDVPNAEMKTLPVIIKADVQGSCEAVKQSLLKLSADKAKDNVRIKIVHAGVGAINESDVMLADTANAVILGFNVRPESKAKAYAEKTKIDIRNYSIIYDAIDDVEKALNGMLTPTFKENIIGHAEIRAVFKITNAGIIAGSYVLDGKVARNGQFRLIRDNIVVYTGKIASVRREKDDVKEVAAGYECGISLENYSDIKVGDIIECFLLEKENNE